MNELLTGDTLFPHKQKHKMTWTSPDEKTVNQIDHILILRRMRTSLLDVRAMRGANVGSDHNLLRGRIKIQ